ncbi:hypothetical protein GCM10010109_63820 [Actinoplanes campanulatus]|nr:hypothetical protein GCM10010109_63820 [Actinoplanes campanulatus]GID39772.1 hypothetical protein Aca09nite_62780 [Actinoplanes campanulatus]
MSFANPRDLGRPDGSSITTVRYIPHADNGVLRDALYEVWGLKCYLCGRPKLFQDIQIDHLIAHTIAAADFRVLRYEHGLPEHFDLHAPANLAPACSDCNRRKGFHVLGAGLLGIHLREAAKREAAVTAMVRGLATTQSIGRALRTLRNLDLNDSAARTAFEQHAPGVVQQLALLDESKADFLVTRALNIVPGIATGLQRPDVAVDIVLDARGRAAEATVEKVGGCTLETVLGAAVDDLGRQIHRHACTSLEDPEVETVSPNEQASWTGSSRVADLDCIEFRVIVEAITIERDAAMLYAGFTGRFRCGFRGSVLRCADDPATAESWNGEVGMDGRFRVTGGWDLTDSPGTPQARTAEILGWDHFKAILWTFRHRPTQSRTADGTSTCGDSQLTRCTSQ